MSLTVTSLSCEQTPRPLGVETLTPRLSWQLSSPTRGARQSAWQVQVATAPELLEAGAPDLWDSGQVESAQSVLVPYAGHALHSRQRCWWRVRVWDGEGAPGGWSEATWWEMGLLQPTDWRAQWIGYPLERSGETPVPPAPLLRREFALDGEIAAARAYISGVGYYELYLNGARVGDHVLDPIVTQYEKHVGYVAYDVTEHLRGGKNAAGAILGNGWYNCHTPEVWNFAAAAWRDLPKLLLQIEVTYTDGRTERIVSDSSWQGASGPIRFDGLRNGEFYDARKEVPGWNRVGFDAALWQGAMIVPGPGGVMFSQQAPPIRVVETMPAVRWWETGPDTYVFDFGQNVAGWCRLQVSGPAGTDVTLAHGERVTSGKALDVAHISTFVKGGEFQTDHYTLKGEGVETWEPRFTYHGFQYVEVTGLPEPPTAATLHARVVQSDFATAGEFVCSDPIINQLQQITRWAYRGNFVGIPTDCPHREKNGWTGDAQLATETGLLNFDVAPALAHWLGTMADTQRGSGQFPGIVPTAGWGYNWGGGPAWDSAFILIPWYIYLYRGDRRLLETHFDAMLQYVEYLACMTKDGIVQVGLGDWCAPDQAATAPDELVVTAFAYMDCALLACIAEELHRPGVAADLRQHSAVFRHAWRGAFLEREEQTALACALYCDLLEPEERPVFVERLRAAIAAAGGHPTFGICGAKWVPRALAAAGYADDAYKLITCKGEPGWVHWLEQGATTLWEDWAGGTSRNHIMFGDISAWFITHLAGIAPDPDCPGFAHFTIRPQLVGDLTAARGAYESPYGRIVSAWTREGDNATLEIEVPVNTTADVYLPGDAGDLPVGDGVLTQSGDGAMVRVGSGSYRFEVRV